MADPYIEAQKRLDRGETVCTIDTSFPSASLLVFGDRMADKTTFFELREQIGMGQTLMRLEGRCRALQDELTRLNAAPKP